MSIESLVPHAGDHSIQSAVLAIEWGGEVDVSRLESLRAAAKPLLAEYPKEEAQQTLRVMLSATQSNVPMPMTSPEVGGYIYSRFSPAGSLQKQLQLTRSNCLLIVSDYSRWRELIEEAKKIYELILPPLKGAVGIAAVGLQYTDRFVWKSSPSDLDFREVFQTSSPYVSVHGLDCRGPWHCHHGYFETSETPVSNNRLDNININVVDEASERVIQIVTSHRAVLTQPLADEYASGNAVKILDALHGVNKSIFKQLLTPPLLKMIGMTDRTDG